MAVRSVFAPFKVSISSFQSLLGRSVPSATGICATGAPPAIEPIATRTGVAVALDDLDPASHGIQASHVDDAVRRRLRTHSTRHDRTSVNAARECVSIQATRPVM